MPARNKRLLVPEARRALDQFKATVMSQKGYPVDRNHPDQVKYEVAERLGVPLNKGYNGEIKAENAGRVGGQIGGSMVKEMIQMAQEQMSKQKK
ncbi:MAG: alpha/beta-type small acid-soluble spore protein [Bacillaceae bacterium]|nr:alpha/beta-type small acid-soluble spore protein [Bacillaceae bacterium]